MTHDTDVAVIGAGIGGLSTALALRADGIEAQVFEQAASLAPVGAALIVRGISTELMRRWADTAHFDREAVRIDTTEFRPLDGGPPRIGSVAIDPDDEPWGYSVHRADLFASLYSPLPAGAVHLGSRIRRVEQDADAAVLVLEDGTTVRASAAIAADGSKSVVRPELAGDDRAIFSGTVACRSVVPAPLLGDLPNDRIRTWFSDGLAFSTFPVRGGAEIAYDAAFMGVTEIEESWNTTVALDDLLPSYRDFPDVVTRILGATRGPISAYGIYDREPIDTWTAGRVALLGDAAHPMLPFLGQGANQAIQDAAVLTEHLAPAIANGGDVPVALAAYAAERAPRTRHYQQGSRRLPGEMSA